MPNFQDGREEMAQDLFGTSSSNASILHKTPVTTSLKTLFLRLERLKKQELSRWWDGGTLPQYLNNKKVPRGLRILIFPTFEDLSVNLLNEWEGNLENASQIMMQILIRHAREKGEKLQGEIEETEKEINAMEQKDLIEKNFVILKKVMDDYQLYLKNKKLTKIRRDDKDYRDGRVYTFARKYDNVQTGDEKIP